MDLSSGYWQVPLNPEDREETAFNTGTRLYQFNVMPFGLENAPNDVPMPHGSTTTWSPLVHLLNLLRWLHCRPTREELWWPSTQPQGCPSTLQRSRVKLKPSKCQFFSKEVTYTWAINTDGVLPDPNNINKVASWPRPQNPTHVRSFLGLASCYRRFIMNFSKIASPLTNLTHKGMKFNWTEKCEDSFNTLKRALINPPLLAYPDFSVEFSPSTDAFLTATGAVLSQVKKGKERE